MQTKRIKEKKKLLKHLESSIILAHLHYENNDCSSANVILYPERIEKIICDN